MSGKSTWILTLSNFKIFFSRFFTFFLFFFFEKNVAKIIDEISKKLDSEFVYAAETDLQ